MNTFVERWRIFWFNAAPTYPLGLIRIAFGTLVACWTLSLLPYLTDLFGSTGVKPVQNVENFQWGLFGPWTSDQMLVAGWAVLLVAGIALAVGWHSRAAAIVVFVLMVSFQHRNPDVFNSGDNLIRIEALLLAISPCGSALSLDRLRSVGRFWSAEIRPQWPIRLMQVQLSLIYLSTVLIKLRGDTWQEGTATSYALRLRDMSIVDVPQSISTDPVLMNVATWGTLAVELAIGVLVWNRACRWWVLGAGVVLHLSIMITLGVGFFSPAMFVLYLAFVPPHVAHRPLESVRARFGRHAAPVYATNRVDEAAP